MRVVNIKNAQDIDDIYCGQEIVAGGVYQLASDDEIHRFSYDAKVHSHLWASKILVGNEELYYTDPTLGEMWLLGSAPVDMDMRPYVRQVVTKPEWHYSPRSIDFYSAKLGSMFNRSHEHDPNDAVSGGTIDGSVDLGDAWLEFFDATNTQLVQGAEESDVDFQSRLSSSCTKTVMMFEPDFDYDIIGAKVQFRNVPTDRAYFWVVAAPDIPKAYGGNVVFMGGGMNISFFSERDTFECDGKSVSRVTYNSDYHSGKVATIIKHNVGVQIGMQMIFQFYSGS